MAKKSKNLIVDLEAAKILLVALGFKLAERLSSKSKG
jgi:hypothetical protein